MAKEILKCQICNAYTLQKKHCDKDTIYIKPAKYSPIDKFGRHRRLYKKSLDSFINKK